MNWNVYVYRYTNQYCVARGLSPGSIVTYENVLYNFADYMEKRKFINDPKNVKVSDVFDYFEYLKVEKNNGQQTIFKVSGVLKKFYQGLVGLGFIDYYKNPLRDFRRVKQGPQKLRDVLNRKEIKTLLKTPKEDTVLGIRDKTLILLLYTTGIRASECCDLLEKDVDLESFQIKVMGKGRKERIIPLNGQTVKQLKKYRKARGKVSGNTAFFRTRLGGAVTRKGLYDRVKRNVKLAKIRKSISPHNLRHSFATELIKNKVSIVTVQKLLGHSSITSTMRYLRLSLQDMRDAIKKHPVNEFKDIVDKFLPDVRLPYQLCRSSFR